MGERQASGRRVARILGPLLAVVCLFGAFAAPAQAAPGYEAAGEFGTTDLPYFAISSTGPRIAVDDATGDVLVAPYEPFVPPGILVYSASGTLLTQIGSGSVAAGGLAIDQANGDLYVADEAGGRVLRYTTDRANPPTYSLDGTYSGPVKGSDYGAGQLGSLLSAVAVDPTNHDLLVADSVGLQVDRYGPDGTFIGSFDGAGSEAGRFTSLLDLAIDATGRTYVVQNGTTYLEPGGFAYAPPIQGSSVVRYAPDGSGGTIIAPGETLSEARAVGVDPTTGRVAVITGGIGPVAGKQLGSPLAFWTFAPDGTFTSSLNLTEPGAKSVTAGIAFDSSSGRLYTASGASFYGGGAGVHVFAPRPVPGVALEVPANVTPFAAQFRGTVTPVGKVATYYFEYSIDEGASWIRTAAEETATGEETPVPISTDVTLEPARSYRVRLIAEDGESTNASLRLAFASPPAAPAVETGTATAVESEQAHLQGSVNPLGSQATYHFEYGITTSYGSRAPMPEGTAGPGRKSVAVGVDITGLAPGTVYHYRLVATGPGGTSAGEDRTLMTPSTAPPLRAYELVSPVEKGNVSVEAGLVHTTALASADGNAMFFSTEKASYPGAESTPYIPRVSATRTEQGWKDISTDPPVFTTTKAKNGFVGTLAVSSDQSRALVVSQAALAPGAISGEPNMYVRNLRTDQYTWVASGDLGVSGGGGDVIFGTGYPYNMIGSTPDLSAVAFMGGLSVSGPNYSQQAASIQNVYEWNEESGLSLVSIDPGGSPFAFESNAAMAPLADPNQLSATGKRVYFEIASYLPEAGLYLRENGKTTAISVSHRPGDPNNPVPAEFLRASADGRYAMFATAEGYYAPPLTPDAPAGLLHAVYRYDAVTEELTYLAGHASVLAAFPQSGDAYYRGGPGPNDNEFYYEHGGISKKIAPGIDAQSHFHAASSDGRYFAFTSANNFTSFENAGVEELYLYDAQSDRLTCPSCRTDGGGPTGPATIGQQIDQAGVNRQVPRAVLDDGTVFFDTPEPLVPGDTNGERDVYSSRDGQATLISRGSQSGESEFFEATPDGRNVFFDTNQQLVPQDTDQAFDLYDARQGGGFASAEAGQPEDCGGTCVARPPAPPGNGSESTSGTPNPRKANRQKPRKCQRKAPKKGVGRKAQCHKHSGSDKKKNHAKKGAGR